jgi:hypothetical protein
MRKLDWASAILLLGGLIAMPFYVEVGIVLLMWSAGYFFARSQGGFG